MGDVPDRTGLHLSDAFAADIAVKLDRLDRRVQAIEEIIVRIDEWRSPADGRQAVSPDMSEELGSLRWELDRLREEFKARSRNAHAERDFARKHIAALWEAVRKRPKIEDKPSFWDRHGVWISWLVILLIGYSIVRSL